MAAYLDVTGFKLATLAPSTYVDEMEAEQPGWLDQQLLIWSAWLDARLQKRYDTPFTAPYPVVITAWLARLVTLQLYLKRGVDATDNQYSDIRDADRITRDEIKEAADSVDGLFDLPLRADLNSTGIVRPTTFFYAEPDPYTWTDVQNDATDR